MNGQHTALEEYASSVAGYISKCLKCLNFQLPPKLLSHGQTKNCGWNKRAYIAERFMILPSDQKTRQTSVQQRQTCPTASEEQSANFDAGSTVMSTGTQDACGRALRPSLITRPHHNPVTVMTHSPMCWMTSTHCLMQIITCLWGIQSPRLRTRCCVCPKLMSEKPC